MKKSVLLVALLVSGAAFAENYPAADFQPKVVYRDPSVISQPASTDDDDSNYPAAHFRPKVLFRDQQALAASQFDPDYPAAYFQPKVIYP